MSCVKSAVASNFPEESCKLVHALSVADVLILEGPEKEDVGQSLLNARLTEYIKVRK